MLDIICHDNGRRYWKTLNTARKSKALPLTFQILYWSQHMNEFFLCYFCASLLSVGLALIIIVSPLLILTFRCAWLVKAEHDTSASPSELINSPFCSHFDSDFSHTTSYLLYTHPLSSTKIPLSSLPLHYRTSPQTFFYGSFVFSSSSPKIPPVCTLFSNSCLHLRACKSKCYFLLSSLAWFSSLPVLLCSRCIITYALSLYIHF